MPLTIKLIQQTWTDIIPDRPFVYSFFDQDVDRVFQEDGRWQQLTRYSALLAIFIACLGAFGLTSLTVMRKRKEIGIRKVFGASIIKIMVFLCREFSLFTLIANFIAWPLVYLLMNRWLNDFSYQVSLEPVYFIAGGVITFVVVLSTVSFQVFRAAKANPVEALRHE